MNEAQQKLEYVEHLVNTLLEYVDHDAQTGHVIDELIGVAIPNLRMELGLPPFDGQ